MPQILDQFEFDGTTMTVLAVKDDGRIEAIAHDWPLEFAEFDTFDGPLPFTCDAQGVSVTVSGFGLLLEAGNMMEAENEASNEREAIDWSAIDEILAQITSAIPQQALMCYPDLGEVSHLLDLGANAAYHDLIIAAGLLVMTHANGLGEADSSEVAKALALATDSMEQLRNPDASVTDAATLG